MDTEELVPATSANQNRAPAVVWILLYILAILTVVCAVTTAILNQFPNGYVYRVEEKSASNTQQNSETAWPRIHQKSQDPDLEFDDDAQDAPDSTSTAPPKTYRIETYTLSAVCWDYSGIWGGVLILIFTIASVPNGKELPRPIYKQVCQTLAILSSLLVSSVAVIWAMHTVSDGTEVAEQYRDDDANYLTQFGYRRRTEDDSATLLEDHSKVLFLTMASTVGTAAFSLLYFLLIVYYAIKNGAPKAREQGSATGHQHPSPNISINRTPSVYACQIGSCFCSVTDGITVKYGRTLENIIPVKVEPVGSNISGSQMPE